MLLLLSRLELHWSWAEIERKWTQRSTSIFFPKLVESFMECFISSIQHHIDCLVGSFLYNWWQSKWIHHACVGLHKCFPSILPGFYRRIIMNLNKYLKGQGGGGEEFTIVDKGHHDLCTSLVDAINNNKIVGGSLIFHCIQSSTNEMQGTWWPLFRRVKKSGLGGQNLPKYCRGHTCIMYKIWKNFTFRACMIKYDWKHYY